MRRSRLKQKEVDVKQQELAAEIEKKADADKYAAEKKAEAELVIRQKEAAGIKAKYEAEAAGIRARGEAEAEAARAKGLAEAEAMEKKAEAYAKYNKAAMAEMMIKVMPQVARSTRSRSSEAPRMVRAASPPLPIMYRRSWQRCLRP